MVGLDPEVYANRYPSELSGGEQQRIGVLRALAVEPDLILMDEPFGALDPITREQLQVEIKQLQRDLNKTIVFVTHDMDEALQLADTVVLMKDGQIVQQASPAEMIAHPANDLCGSLLAKSAYRIRPTAHRWPRSWPPTHLLSSSRMICQVCGGQWRQNKQILRLSLTSRGGQLWASYPNRRFKRRWRRKTKKLLDLVADASPATIRRSTSVKDAAAVLANGSRILCVVDRHGRPVGLVNRRTLLNGLVDMWEESA